MLEFLSRLYPRGAAPPSGHEDVSNDSSGNLLLPLPVTQKGAQAKWKKHDLKPLDTTRASSTSTMSISAPIPKSSPHSLTGFDDSGGKWLYYPFPPPPNHIPPPPPPPSHPPPQSPHLMLHSHPHAQVASAQAHTQAHVQGLSHHHLTRTGPSNVAWLGTGIQTVDPESDVVDNDIDDQQPNEVPVPLPELAPPAVIRMPSKTQVYAGAHTPTIIPIGRSVSSPIPSTNNSSDAVSSTLASPKWNLRLNTSTHSLRLDSSTNPHPRPSAYASTGAYPIITGSSTDLFGYAYNYPLAKQLSPIAEQDYISPESLRRSLPLPGSGGGKDGVGSTRSDGDGGVEGSPSLSYSYSHTNPSPSGSQTSEITRTYFRRLMLSCYDCLWCRSFAELLHLTPVHLPTAQSDNFTNFDKDTTFHCFFYSSCPSSCSRVGICPGATAHKPIINNPNICLESEPHVQLHTDFQHQPHLINRLAAKHPTSQPQPTLPRAAPLPEHVCKRYGAPFASSEVG
jgi:hypothetical protein